MESIAEVAVWVAVVLRVTWSSAVERDEGDVARGECGRGAIGRYVVAGAECVVIRSSSESEAADEAEDMV